MFFKKHAYYIGPYYTYDALSQKTGFNLYQLRHCAYITQKSSYLYRVTLWIVFWNPRSILWRKLEFKSKSSSTTLGSNIHFTRSDIVINHIHFKALFVCKIQRLLFCLFLTPKLKRYKHCTVHTLKCIAMVKTITIAVKAM